jgi:hypothetical protein
MEHGGGGKLSSDTDEGGTLTNADGLFLHIEERAGSSRPIAPEHAAYWHGLALDGYEGGPFADRSGGLITFQATSTEAAEAWVAGDPFVEHDLLTSSWLKEWVPAAP